MTLLQRSLSGGVMIMAIIIIRALCIHHLPKRLLTAFWSLPLIRLLIPYALPFSGSVYTLLARRTSAAYQPIQTPAVPLAVTATPAAVQEAAPAEALSVSWWNVLYLVGLAAFAVYFLTAYVRSLREFRTALPVRSAQAQRFLEAHPLRRHVTIRQSDRIAAPLSYGVFRPVILLPSGTDWSDEAALRYVLTHEMAHIRRLDAVTKLILTIALCVHWFNPLVWVMNILANRDIELSCDADVLRQVGWQSRSDYALTLISMEERKSGLAPLSSSFSKNAIEERIIAMMKFKKTSVSALVIALILILSVSAAFATTAAPDQPTTDWTMRQEALEGWQKGEAEKSTQLSPEEMMALYGAYGISYDAQGKLLYQGEKVRYFCDGVGTGEGEWFIRHDFFNKDGTVDVYTQRAFVDNGDGSVNPFGPLTGLRRATYDEFENLNIVTTTDDDVMEEAVADVFTLTDSGHHAHHPGDTHAVADVFSCDNSASGQSLADRFGCYADFGVVFDGKGLGSVSFCGEPVRKFIDIQPDGGVFTYTAPDGDGISVCTVYDGHGVLTGVEVFE